MNPFIYPALMVLCVGSIMTRQLDSGGTPSVWAIAACMLASIGLAATTGTGTRGAIVTTVLLAACVACVIFLWSSSEKRSRERRLRRAAMYA